MIAFDLQCSRGHTFEGWFEDGRSFEAQRDQGLVACPFCDDTAISKLPSMFAIKSSGTPVPQSRQRPASEAEMAALGRQIVQYVEKNFDDVGTDFAKEALKIHYGAEEPRNIRGVSTQEEEKTLEKEGIKFFKFPVPATAKHDN